jgi:undecaprenyl-diphosphatase
VQLLVDFDTYVFYKVNGGLKNSLLDVLMPFVTNYRNWYFVIPLIILLFIVRDWKKGLTTILLVIIAVSISDYLNSHIAKYFFGRLRPCNKLPIETLNLIMGCPHNPSFPSSHAVNIFALSTVLVYRHRRLLLPMLFIAVLVCLSRVYLGVHYPFDVIVGGICGILYGSVVIFIYNQVIRKYEKTKSIKD